MATHDDTEPAVLVGHRDGVLLLTINRPKVMNAVNTAVSRGIGTALEEADADPSVRAVVLTGAGTRSFCAGLDLKEAADPGRERAATTVEWGFAGFTRHPIRKPTIAAVNGFALGGGTEAALAADLIVAVEHATFGLPEVRRGILASGGGLVRLPRQLPAKLAMEAILTGQPIDAATALRFGLVNRVVAPDEPIDASLALATAISANAPLAVEASARVARAVVGGLPEEEAWRLCKEETAAVMQSVDAREGIAAFAEKRPPNWQGR